jgi:hypothetical protein
MAKKDDLGLVKGGDGAPPISEPDAINFALEATNKGVETSPSEGLLLEAS